MKFLITGIHGFVGSNLVAAYKNLHRLHGLDIVDLPKVGVEATFSWDEWEKMPAVDIIIHLAGKAHDTKNVSSPQSYFDVNLGLAQKIFDYFLQSEANKFILFSSVKAVADTVQGEFLTEEDIPDPETPYGQSKLAAEQYILSKKLPPNKKVYILRPSMIHGPGNKGNLNLLYQLAQKRLPWPLGSFNNSRSLLSIDNLIFVLDKLIQKDIGSGIYQVADDTPVSTNEIIKLMAYSMGHRANIWHLPISLVKGLAQTGDLLHFPLNSERLKKLTESYVVSNNKIKKVLRINKMPISAKEGLLKTFNSFIG